MPSSVASSWKETWTLVEFKYGDKASPTYLRLTDRATDYTDGLSILWTSCPQMEVSECERAIALEEKPVTIKLPLELPFVDRVSNGEPHSPVEVSIREVFDDGVTVTGTWLFRGDLKRTIRNVDGRMAQAALECLSEKSQYNVPLGLLMDGFCINTFGGPGCFLDLTPFKQNKTITDILPSGYAIHLGSVSTPTTGQGADPESGNGVGYWARGYIELNGLRITIREMKVVTSGVATPTLPFGNWWIMQEAVPQDWLGQTVTMVPGCTKQLERCQEWENEERFSASGLAMPALHPNLESE